MPDTTDMDLVRDFAAHRSEAAFAEIVRRHLNLVYSVALRYNGQDGDAQDIAQAVFMILARKAARLSARTVLAGWLYETTRFTAAHWQRSAARRHAREQEAYMQSLNADSSDAWQQLSPHLEAAMSQLAERDRTLLALRFYQNKTGTEAAALLGIGEDAAHKRTARALEKLRKIFKKRGIALTSAGIATAISSNAVQSAPAGLAAAITTGALSGTAVTAAAIVAATTKTIIMTTLQKAAIGAALVVTAGAGVFEAHKNSQLRSQCQELEQQQAPLAAQIQQLQAERDAATNQLAGLASQVARLQSNPHQMEVLKLRGEVNTLRSDVSKRKASDSSLAQMVASPQMKDFMKTAMASTVDKTYAKLFADLHLTPEQTATLKDLLVKKTVVGMDAGSDLISGKMDAAGMMKLGQDIKAQKDQIDSQIKDFLGDDGYATYQAYEKTYQDRAMVSGPAGFSDQLAGDMVLTPDQTEQLVQALADARQNFKFSVDYSDKTKLAAGFANMYSEDNLARYAREQNQLNDNYLARAQSILTPEQLASFQQFLTNRLEMGVMSMKMTAKMFAPNSSGN